MKTTTPPLLSFSLPQLKEESQVQTLYQSPYLRAILSDNKINDTARMISIANSSMAAALRYISNTNR